MADYIAKARSNYFKVKDPKRFERWCRFYGVDSWTNPLLQTPDATYYAIGNDDGGGWPSMHPETEAEIDFAAELQQHLQPDNVAVIVETAHEGMRYVGGWATAIHPDGRFEHVSLDAITTIAREAFGDAITITDVYR